jgi:hypothetical protein
MKTITKIFWGKEIEYFSLISIEITRYKIGRFHLDEGVMEMDSKLSVWGSYSRYNSLISCGMI